MINKRFLLIVALIAALFYPTGLTAANDLNGRWTMYPAIGYDISKVVETGDRMYAVSNGKLFSRDADTDEIYIYSTANKLSDTDVADIFYNADGKYLLVSYNNGNLDMIYDNGKVVNLPEIKDAVISSGHGINHATFADGRIYLATEFGLAVYDDKKQEIIDSGIYNKNASHIFPMGDYLLLMIGDDIYYAPKDMRHHSFDSFTLITGVWSKAIHPVSDTALAYTHSSGLYKIEINFADNTLDRSPYGIKPSADKIQKLDDGTIMVYTDDTIYTIDENGIKDRVGIPAALKGSDIFSSKGASSIWMTDTYGIGHYDISGDTPTVLAQPFRPEALTVDEVYGCSWSTDGQRLYIVTRTPAQFVTYDNADLWNGRQMVNIFHPATGEIKDVTVPEFDPKGYSTEMAGRQTASGWPGLVGGPSRVAADPDDPEVWYQAFNGEPFFAFRNNEVIASFNNQNCYTGGNGARGYSIQADHEGNLWLGLGHRSAPDPSFLILPAAKRRGDLSSVSKSDFIPLAVPGFSGTREMGALICRHSNYVFLTAGESRTGIAVIDTKGTLLDLNDDTAIYHSSFKDTEGHALEANRFPFPVEDLNGQIWCPSDIGPLVITRPSSAMSSDFAFRRPIVPRNDGTQFGDYLLDGVQVLSIAVDHSNRKWLSTRTDGVYLVNEDGTEIIQHFTSENSPLTSNTVNFVACDPHSNKVFFGASDGLYVFDSDSSPAAEDYSDVYAYPNPVRPEYTGWITVAGLKDNSLVKIADIAGNVFFQGRSEGGMISWDGCNSAGERVRTGVYFVFASENADGGSSGAVAKIMVVN